MGCAHSTTFNHPDLLVTFGCNPAANCFSQKWYRCNSSGCCIGAKLCCAGDAHGDGCVGDAYGFCGFRCGDTTDPGWVRNSPLRIELVDLLSDALKAMGGWPKFVACGGACCSGQFHSQVAPRLVEAINKVCKKFNDAKLFDMGLQCRAITHIKKEVGQDPIARLLVLVEKKSEYTLGDVGESLEHLRWLEAGPWQGTCLHADEAKSLLAWSPPEDWMTRLTPPYNESTNHV